jgi:hypothetical protein
VKVDPELDEELDPPLDAPEASTPPNEPLEPEEPDAPLGPDEPEEPEDPDPDRPGAPELEAEKVPCDPVLDGAPRAELPLDPELAPPSLSLLANGTVELVSHASSTCCMPNMTASNRRARMKDLASSPGPPRRMR